MWSWGSDAYGEAGNGTTSAWVTAPTKVLATSGSSGFLTGIVAVATGTNHSLALDKNGNAWSWGRDEAGELGNADATLASRSLPVQVKSGGVTLTNVVAIAAGSANGYALTKTGSVLAWGDNTIGELSNGTVSATPATASLSATAVSGLSTTVTALSNQSLLDSTATL